MSFGQVTDQQACAIQPFILGRVVHDLGCGDQYLSKRLVAWGAKTVIAVDKTRTATIPAPRSSRWRRPLSGT
jgi:predicted RNA methylase